MFAVFLRFIFFTLVLISIISIYYTKVIQQDFEVYNNPEGPDTTDYFIPQGEI